MTKADIAKELYERNHKRFSRIDTLKENLAEGKTVKIAGLGTFTVRKKGERIGRNPKTKEEIPIPPRKVATFKASSLRQWWRPRLLITDKERTNGRQRAKSIEEIQTSR